MTTLGDNYLPNEEEKQNAQEIQPFLKSENVRPQIIARSQLATPGEMSSTPKVLPQYIAALCATLGGLCMGTVLGYSSPAGALLTSNSTDPDAIYLTVNQNSWFSSTANIGALFGGLMGGYFINLFGRRGAMIYSIFPTLLGWALIAAAQNFIMLVIGRVVTGFCAGLISFAVPTYIGEFSSAHIRGTLGTIFQVMVMSGILFVYCMGAAFSSFQWIAGVCAIIPCVFSTSMLFNKESPIYLLAKNKEDEAEKALKHFRGNNYSGISSELKDMKESLEQRKLKKATIRDLTIPYILKPFLTSVGLMFFQQFCGINAVLFNMAIIFQTAGSDMSITLSSIIVGITFVLATLLSAMLMDKAGRKILLVVSAALMGISLVALGIFFYLKETDSSNIIAISWLPLASLIVFVIGFNVGFGPIPWLMLGELFSPEVKELSGSIATMSNWGCSFIVTLIFAPLQSAISIYGVYWMFAGFCALSIVFVVTFVYETKGKTLPEITEHFGGPKISSDEKNSKGVC